MSIEEQLNELVNNSLREEGIDPGLLEHIDLGVAYSPVLMSPGEPLQDAAEVIPCEGKGNYIVRHRTGDHAIMEGSLKIMRLRYLIALKAQQKPFIDSLFKGKS